MPQIIEENKKPSFMDRLGAGIQGAGQEAANMMTQRLLGQQKQKQQAQMAQKLQQLTGMDLEVLSPEMQQEAFKYHFQGKNAQDLERIKQLGKKDVQSERLNLANSIFGGQKESSPSKNKPKGILSPEYENTSQLTPEEQTVNDHLKEQGVSPSHLSEQDILQLSAIDPTLGNAARQLRDTALREERSREEFEHRKDTEKNKAEQKEIENAKKETLPFRTEIANRANAARRGVQNKKHLIDLINTGNINDPTYATILSEFIPNNLGKRLLSNETVEYKAGLVDEFTDLRNIFQGQTRIKEIDILEDKLADLYLTDEQKKSVLKSRMNALQSDIIREEAAEEIERDYPKIGALQFSKKVDELTQKKMEPLFNKILNEQQAIIQAAEDKKGIPLDNSDPEDKKIMDQIFQESGGDKKKAWELAKKKGYKFKGFN